ncbi:MAG: AsmA family protein [Rhodobacteraceae bacterium]|nr:AsmA family protein [Paracoccaceae bacterium]
MRRWILRLLTGLIVLTLVLGVLIWAVLATPLFSNWRKDIVADILTEQIGQPFLIDGDVRVVLAGTTKVHVSGASIPSENIADTNLARLDLLEWELDLPALLDRRIDIDNLTIDGLQVNLITKAGGTTSWTKTNTPQASEAAPSAQEDQPAAADPDGPSILSFLADRTVSFTNIGLAKIDEQSGFEFIFALEKILLEQQENGQLASVTGAGTLNGEEFTWDGKFPDSAPFTNQLEFGDISLSYNGAPLPEGARGYTARLELTTGQIGDVFEVLGLARSLEGTGALSVDITSAPQVLTLENLQTTLDLNKGQNVTVTGEVGNLFTRADFDIRMDARLHPDGQPPADATSLKDIKLTEIHAHVLNTGEKLTFEELLIQTNAFDQGLDRVGPISIGQIYRSEQKTLGLRDIALQAGPEDAPYITAKGDIGDVFNLGLVDLTGALKASADLLLKNLPPEEVAKFGRVEAKFIVEDKDGALSLRQLEARTVDTDLWSLNAGLVVASLEDLAGMDLGVEFDVADTAPFLSALGLKPVGVSSLSTKVSLKGAAKEAQIGFDFRADGTDLTSDITFDLSQEINVIRGSILSQRMRLRDLREGGKVLVQLNKRAQAAKAANAKEEDDGRPPIQPLVLEKKSKVFSLKRILTETDLAITLELAEFVGDAGTSSMSSELIAKEGQIQAGPIELYYGPGFFKVTASMDAIENPDRARIQGRTSGWDFGEILKALEVNIPARGKLSANVDVTGNITSGKAFMNSMVGTASLDMHDGAIATSLLELAGLGIFPWLFSQEFAEGQTEIVCVKAPVKINAGNVAFTRVVAETRSVQMVVRGMVDWVKDAIAIRAEPRRVGQPLARSAWPFEVTGKLSDPQFKLQVGGSRSRRADGADQMPANRKPCTPDIYQLEQASE